MPREPWKRGKEVNTIGILREFACVLCGIDRIGNIYSGLICNGRPKHSDIDRALKDILINGKFCFKFTFIIVQ